MPSIAQEFFLLMSSLSQLRNSELVVDLFVEAVNSYNSEFSIAFSKDRRSPLRSAFEIRTVQSSFGYLEINGKPEVVVPEFYQLLQNAVQMLAVILENLQRESLLKNENENLNLLVDEKTQLLLEKEKLLSRIAANYPHSFLFIVERDLSISFTSGQEFQKQNIDPENFVGKTIDALFQDYASSMHDKCLLTFNGQETEFEIAFNNQCYQFRNVPFTNNNKQIEQILSVAENITDRKLSELSHRQNEKKFRHLFNTISQGIIYQASDGSIIDANPASETILDINIDQMRGINPIDPRWHCIHEDGTRFTLETLPKTVALITGKDVVNAIMGVYHCSENKYRWLIVNSTPQFIHNDPKPYQAITTFTDITDRKLAEDKISRLTKIYQVLSDTNQTIVREKNEIELFQQICNITMKLGPFSLVWICMYDAENNVLVPKAGAGEAADSLNGLQLPLDLNIPEGNSLASLAFRTNSIQVKNDNRQFRDAHYWLSQSVTKGVVSAACLPLRLNNKAVGVLSIGSSEVGYFDDEVLKLFEEMALDISFGLYNITQAKILDDTLTALKLSEERFSKAFQSNPAAVLIVKLSDGKIIDANRSFQYRFGFDRGELIGHSIEELDVFIDKSKIHELVDIITVQSTLQNYYSTLKTKSGELRDFLQSIELIEISGEICLISTFIDITDEKKAQDQLQSQYIELIAAKEKVDQSDKLKTAFLANMSHEIRTPMNGIIGFSKFLREDDLDSTERKEYADIIIESANRLLSIVNDVLEVARLDTGLIKVKESIFPVDEIIQYLNNMFFHKITNKGLEYSFSIPKYKDISIFIKSDKDKLIQILTNFLNNAVKFTDKGNIHFGCEIEDGGISFFVKDTGIGIDQQYINSIFDRFWQVEALSERKFGGTGLGLSISKSLAEILKGDIGVTSQPGMGSTFKLTIPFDSSLESDATIYLNEPQTYRLSKKQSMNILIAEDEETNFHYLQTLLQSNNISITHAMNGSEAVEYVQKAHFDLVLMDLKMPVMNGFEATRIIRGLFPRLPIIAQTAFSQPEEKEQAISAGCNNFISKPINENELFKLINDSLRMR